MKKLFVCCLLGIVGYFIFVPIIFAQEDNTVPVITPEEPTPTLTSTPTPTITKSNPEEQAVYNLNKGLLPKDIIKEQPEDQSLWDMITRSLSKLFSLPLKFFAQSETIHQATTPLELKPTESSPAGQIQGFLGGSAGFYGVVLPTEVQSNSIKESEENFEKANFPEGIKPVTGNTTAVVPK